MVLRSRVYVPPSFWSADEDPEREAKCRKFPLPSNHEVTPETDPFFMDEEEATDICNGTWDNKVCPFRQFCLYRALVNNEQWGASGGMTAEQRRWIRRNRELIPRESWDINDAWRHLVPSPERLLEMALEETDDDEKA